MLKKNGTPIPENDMWIAATCKKLNVPLLTQDKHFESEKLRTLIS
ncbi:MAG: PIN domain-containing protein [Ignavibacteriales bacterium]|nr:PIN domain-containing protein [Ignavibacteriales bacterium]